MTETYYKVRREALGVSVEYAKTFHTPAEAAAFVDEQRKTCRGYEFHIDEKTREKKPTFRF